MPIVFFLLLPPSLLWLYVQCSTTGTSHLYFILISNSKEDSPKYSLAICYTSIPFSFTQLLAFWGYEAVSILRTPTAFQRRLLSNA